MKITPEDFIPIVPMVGVILIAGVVFGIYVVITNFPHLLIVLANHR